jgi:hypothetical protein
MPTYFPNPKEDVLELRRYVADLEGCNKILEAQYNTIM